jgi:hypothetical protein
VLPTLCYLFFVFREERSLLLNPNEEDIPDTDIKELAGTVTCKVEISVGLS